MRTAKLLSAFVLCAALAGCLGQQARDHVLAPVFSTTLPRVVEYASASPDVQPATIDQFADAINGRRFTDAMTLWPQVRAWGDSGIDAMQAAGKFGPMGAGERHETLTRFDADLRKAVRL